MQNRWIALTYIAVAELLALSVWFSASSVALQIDADWHLGPVASAALTSAVQAGFVAGALASSWTGLADRIPGRRLLTASALACAVANGLFVFSGGFAAGILLRFLTGVALAGVYPVAVKLLAEWFPSRRGLAMGMLIAALTAGSALPHLIVFALGSVAWQDVVAASTVCAAAAAGIAGLLLRDSGVRMNPRAVSLSGVSEIVRNRPVMLANHGYFGHMWELYAMWTWLPAFLYASDRFSWRGAARLDAASLGAFVCIGVAGALGAVSAGWAADRFGRTAVAIASLSVSGLCAVGIGWTYRGPVALTLSVAVLWGVSIIADSAQFSVVVTELVPQDLQGSALAFQMAIGFLITVVSINMMPAVVAWLHWKYAMAVLALGPAWGLAAMVRLRRLPEARRLAGGLR